MPFYDFAPVRVNRLGVGLRYWKGTENTPNKMTAEAFGKNGTGIMREIFVNYPIKSMRQE